MSSFRLIWPSGPLAREFRVVGGGCWLRGNLIAMAATVDCSSGVVRREINSRSGANAADSTQDPHRFAILLGTALLDVSFESRVVS